MAPYDRRRKFLRSPSALRDVLGNKERSNLKAGKDSKYGYRDYSGDEVEYLEDHVVSTPTAQTHTVTLETPTSSITSGLHATLSPLIPSMTSTLPATFPIYTKAQIGLSASSTAPSRQGGQGLELRSVAPTVSSQTAATSTSTQAPVPAEGVNHSLSPMAQHVLISAATIGAIIFIGTIVYCVLRFLKIDVMAKLRKFNRRGRGSWRPGSFSGTENYAPPYTTLSDEKFIPSIRKPYAPIVIEPVPMAVLPSTQELSRADTERQKLVREALLSKLEDTALYHETLQSGPEPQPARQPSLAYTHNRPYSELSSLSSGFGDAKIDIPESGPTKLNSQRKSRASRASRASQKENNYSRFSWSSNPTTLGRGRGNRDTIYTSTTTHTTLTTSSEESGPRFRTVNSWVSHQAKRVQRQKEHDREIDSMPALPPQAHMKKAHHQRLQSETTDPGFKYHPGEEVPLASGKRVPSAILDKII